MTIRKYSFLLANSSHKYIWELYLLAKYGNFVLNIQNFEKTPKTFLNEYQKSNWFLKKKVICQNSSQTVLTPAIIWELSAKKSADRPNCHYSSVTFSTQKPNVKGLEAWWCITLTYFWEWTLDQCIFGMGWLMKFWPMIITRLQKTCQ